jgi:hypothetical protein
MISPVGFFGFTEIDWNWSVVRPSLRLYNLVGTAERSLLHVVMLAVPSGRLSHWLDTSA